MPNEYETAVLALDALLHGCENELDLRLAIMRVVAVAVLAERESCAVIAECQAGGHYMAQICAAAIRADPSPDPPPATVAPRAST